VLDTLEVSDGVGGIQSGSNYLVYGPNRVFGTDRVDGTFAAPAIAIE